VNDTVGFETRPRLHQPVKEIQAFGAIRRMPIALGTNACTESAQLLNQLLADTVILHSLYKKHHWLIRGHTFYQLHLLLDKHAGEQEELIDLMAERVQTLGGVAVADARHVAELTRIERPPNGAEEVPAMLSRLLEAHEVVINDLRLAVDKASENKDWGTNDLLAGNVLRTNELQVWFIAEHLVDTPSVRQ
jgi:starvation-inducible DNA-binding protein